MSVLIKGMEMPKNCDECWKKYHGFGMVEHDEEWGTFYCKLAKGFCSDPRTKCPLVPVPDHGRLIDADALNEAMARMVPWAIVDPTANAFLDGLSAAYEAIQSAPTIIPAEEGEK